MKIYLSGPITGIPEYNAPAFQEATAHLRSLGHEVISPIEEDEKTNSFDKKWGTLLARDVAIIANDGIEALYVLPGWSRSKGSRLEVFEALLLGIPVFGYKSQRRYTTFALAALVCKGLLRSEK